MLTQVTFRDALCGLITNPETSAYLLAVSGGVDSMVMLHLFHQLKLPFAVAHVNYKLRGADSEADQKAVEDYCNEHSIRLYIYEVSADDNKPENSIQLWARDLRYRFFRGLQEKFNLKHLVTAHHLNDQLETFITNLSKAAGLNGLTAIPANENGILRPLLKFSRTEIEDFAATHHVNFRTDISNFKTDYLRNYIRHEISPKLFETNKHFLQNFAKSLAYLNQAKNYIQKETSRIETEIISRKDHLVIIDKQKILQQDPLVRFEILRKYGFNSEAEHGKIFSAENGKFFRSPDFQLSVERDHLVINGPDSTENTAANEEINLIESFPPESITLSLHPYISEDFAGIALQEWHIDAEKITFPLKIRHQKGGDVFYPTGMSGSKKVAKFFKDEKIPTFAKQKIWLLCDDNDDVLGVIPYRQDRRSTADENAECRITIKF